MVPHIVIPAPWKAKAGGLEVWAQPGKLNNVVTPCFKMKMQKKVLVQCKDPGFNQNEKNKTRTPNLTNFREDIFTDIVSDMILY